MNFLDSVRDLQGTALFYPCSGYDWLEPILTFLPVVKSFWFADPRLHRSGSIPIEPFLEAASESADGPLAQGRRCTTRRSRDPGRNASRPSFVRRGTSLCLADHTFKRLSWEVREQSPVTESSKPDPDGNETPWVYAPLTVSERYLDASSGAEFAIHAHRCDGQRSLDLLPEPLGIFYLRGDNGSGNCEGAEGSSGSGWLTRSWFEPVLRKLVPGGLVVTDGSCSGDGKDYPGLCEFFYNRNVGEDAWKKARPFTTPCGHHFECVGYAGEAYGPTLVWKVTQPS